MDSNLTRLNTLLINVYISDNLLQAVINSITGMWRAESFMLFMQHVALRAFTFNAWCGTHYLSFLNARSAKKKKQLSHLTKYSEQASSSSYADQGNFIPEVDTWHHFLSVSILHLALFLCAIFISVLIY